VLQVCSGGKITLVLDPMDSGSTVALVLEGSDGTVALVLEGSDGTVALVLEGLHLCWKSVVIQ